MRSQNLAVLLRRDLRQWHRDQERDLVPIRRIKTVENTISAVEDLTGKPAPLAKYVAMPIRLRVRFKGKLYRAKVRRDGTILYDGITYKTPSAAGTAVRKKPTNGWQFWHYERAPGDWIPLSKIRQ